MIKILACSALRACLVWQGRELYFIMLCGMCIMLRFVRRLKIKNNYFLRIYLCYNRTRYIFLYFSTYLIK